jgi:hypothetical protein
MHDPAIVQVSQTLGDFAQEERRLLRPQSRRRLIDQIPQRGPVHVLHDHERLPLRPEPHVKNRHQVRALEIHALADPAQLDLLIRLHVL